MKKFSTTTGQKVNEEPKVEIKKVNEEDIFKSKVMDILDKNLKITTYGPVDRYLRAGSIKISGKELFLEALLDLIEDNSNKKVKSILEGLKSKIRDWETIDEAIENIEVTNRENNFKHLNKVLSIYNKWGADKKLCKQMFEKHIDGIKNPENAWNKYLVSEKLSTDNNYPEELFKYVAEKYLEKAKQLGFNK